MKARGHPPRVDDGEPSTPVNVRLSSSEYDYVYAKAQRDRVSVPDVVRRGLAKLLEDDDDDE
jgi:hypothetical protein